MFSYYQAFVGDRRLFSLLLTSSVFPHQGCLSRGQQGGPEILVASSPHFKQVFFLMMGGPGLMGGPTFQMGGPAVLPLIISSLCNIGF